ncbi:MAG: hypothetical protein ACKVQS_05920 [Fimbriimonadaceae bacterium]
MKKRFKIENMLKLIVILVILSVIATISLIKGGNLLFILIPFVVCSIVMFPFVTIFRKYALMAVLLICILGALAPIFVSENNYNWWLFFTGTAAAIILFLSGSGLIWSAPESNSSGGIADPIE